MAELNFDANTVKPGGTFEPLPTGWYNVTIVESQNKVTKDKKGAYLELVLSIADGEYVNRKLYARLNLQNTNPIAVEIAQGQLSAICHATKVMQVKNSDQLHGKPLQARAVFKPEVKDDLGNVKYDATNEVKGFKSLDGAVASGGGTPTGGNDTPDWVTEGAEKTEAPAIPETPPPIPETPVVPEKPTAPVMTEKANGISYEDYGKQGWTDELLVEHGYMEVPAPAGPPKPPVAPSDAADGSKPPWAK